MILIISTCFNKFHEEEFVNPIEQLTVEQNKEYEIKHYTDVIDLEKYTHIIICGTALKDEEYLKGNFTWIKEYKKPILGICAGAQIIAKEFGEEIKKGQEIGLVEIEKVEEDEILKDVQLNEIYCLHNMYTELPEGFDLILTTKYPQLFRKENIVASLFHPEVRNQELIRNFLKI